jgi:hypothetical protein
VALVGCGADDAVEGGASIKTGADGNVAGIDAIGLDGMADVAPRDGGQDDLAVSDQADPGGATDATQEAEATQEDVDDGPDAPACDPAQCDDKNPCTKDECQAGKCASVPAEGPCDDADRVRRRQSVHQRQMRQGDRRVRVCAEHGAVQRQRRVHR